MTRPKGIHFSFDILQLPTHPHQPSATNAMGGFPPSCEREFLSTRNNEDDGPRRGRTAEMRTGDGLSCPSPQNVHSYYEFYL